MEIALTYIYGIGRSTSYEILSKLNIDPQTKTDDLTEGQVNDIRKITGYPAMGPRRQS